MVTLRMAKWALDGKELFDISINDIISNWEACILCITVDHLKEKRLPLWTTPMELWKFNVRWCY